MAHKQLVFIVTSDRDGKADQSFDCAQKGGIEGPAKRVEYIPDNRLPFDEKASVVISGALSGGEIINSELNGRQTWSLDGPVLSDEPVRVVLSGAGKGKSGSFVVTCS